MAHRDWSRRDVLTGMGSLLGASLWRQAPAAPTNVRVTANGATPGLHGAFSHGATVTVSGSGFGTKTPAAPYRYDDFQGASIGQDLIGYRGWTGARYTSIYNHPVCSTLGLRPGTPFDRHMRCWWRAYDGNYTSSAVTLNGLLLPPGQTFYLDAWMWHESLDPSGLDNCKPIRFHNVPNYSPNIYFAFWDWAASNWYGKVCARDGGIYGPGSDEGGVGTGNVDLPPEMGPAMNPHNKWVHWQVAARMSGRTTFDGQWTAWYNGRLVYNRVNNICLASASATDEWDLFLGNWIQGSNVTGDSQAFWECIYFDKSWARVELGDAATYSACAHREIQIPSAWSDSAVQITLNRGSFAPSAACWLFVINAANTVVATYPVTLGSTY